MNRPEARGGSRTDSRTDSRGGDNRSENRAENRADNRGGGRGDNRGDNRPENRRDGRNTGRTDGRSGRDDNRVDNREDAGGRGNNRDTRFDARGPARGQARGDSRGDDRRDSRSDSRNGTGSGAFNETRRDTNNHRQGPPRGEDAGRNDPGRGDSGRGTSAPGARMRPAPGRNGPQRFDGSVPRGRAVDVSRPAVERQASGILDIRQDGTGYLRTRDNWIPDPADVLVLPGVIRSYALRAGQEIVGTARMNGRGAALSVVHTVEGLPAADAPEIARFTNLEAEIPFERLHLETNQETLGTRIIDLLAPLGKGQRGLIVAPPQAGKTRILRDIATGIATRHPETRLFMLLIDERPEEVTELRSMGIGQVIASTFDESRSGQLAAAELALERMMRLVEAGKDVFVLIDSLTRLARASNLAIRGTGRSLSGGLDPAALTFPRKLFGAARATRNAGNLTILATALVETGSVMDEFVFQEFKGTGNWEVRLDRKLAQRRIFPAIDINASSTRREELLYTPQELHAVTRLRQYLWKFSPQPEVRAERLVFLLSRTKSNAELLSLVERL